jgi:hypothetical protein
MCGPAAWGQEPASAVDRSYDRGTGVATSLFATFIDRGELIIYPFFEYYRDEDYEYRPADFGYADSKDRRGRYRAREGLVFVAYGLTQDLSVEFEVSAIRATLDKDAADDSNLPSHVVESGLGDVEGQVRWRFRRETERRPELFGYAEFVVPHHGDRALTGTAGAEANVGVGVIRAFRWGTLLARGALEYDAASSSPFDLGEYAVEYVRRLSRTWRVDLALEGAAGEASVVTDVQWHFSPHAFLRINNGFALTRSGTDWAPEIGIVTTWSPR